MNYFFPDKDVYQPLPSVKKVISHELGRFALREENQLLETTIKIISTSAKEGLRSTADTTTISYESNGSNTTNNIH